MAKSAISTNITPITLTTDFGFGPFVAALKGAILSINQQVVLIDVTHDIPPQDINATRMALESFWDLYPPGTIHLVIVNPYVGTGRAIILKSNGRWLIGPDNGILSPAISKYSQAWAISSYESTPIFTGRDNIFAPTAARLARGVDPDKIATLIEDPLCLFWPEPEENVGEILTCDHFGNLYTSFHKDNMEKIDDCIFSLHGFGDFPMRTTYANVLPGEKIAVVNSLGYVELAINQDNLKHKLIEKALIWQGRKVECRNSIVIQNAYL